MLGTDVFALPTAYIMTKSTNLMSAKFLLTAREIRAIIWSTGNADRRSNLSKVSYKRVTADFGRWRLLFCVEKRNDQRYNDAKHREYDHENFKVTHKYPSHDYFGFYPQYTLMGRRATPSWELGPNRLP